MQRRRVGAPRVATVATPEAPATAPAPSTVEAPAPADQPQTGYDILESDILNPNGSPFKTRVAAEAEQKRSGGTLVQVPAGWVVRLEPKTGEPGMEVQPAGTRGTNAKDIGASTVEAPARPSYAGEPIDDEWTAFSPESGTKGIPRADMPQIKAGDRSSMVQFLRARGIEYATEADVDLTTLKPTQAEFSPAKVQGASEYVGGDRAILVPSDGHVLDGNKSTASPRVLAGA